jgi:putative transposase
LADFLRWKKKFGSIDVAEVRRLNQLKGENAKLERLVADLSLDKAIPQDVLRKEVWLRASAAGSSATPGMPSE